MGIWTWNFFWGDQLKKSPCINLNLEKGIILFIFVRKAVQEETSRNVEESARWLSSAPGGLQPVQEEAGGLPHLTHNKGKRFLLRPPNWLGARAWWPKS